jgi:hypothetical protein
MFLVDFESTNLIVLLKQEKKTTGLNQSYSDSCFISFVHFDSPSYPIFRFFQRFLLFRCYPLNIVLLAIWRCTRKWEKGAVNHLNFHGELWYWWRCRGALLSSTSTLAYFACQWYVYTLTPCRPFWSVLCLLWFYALCAAEHDLGAFYPRIRYWQGLYFWFLPCFH